jgi:exopolysaccharide production protein ExoQ
MSAPANPGPGATFVNQGLGSQPERLRKGVQAFRDAIARAILPLFLFNMAISFVLSVVAPIGLVVPAIAMIVLLLLSSTTRKSNLSEMAGPELGIIVVFAAWSLLCALWSPDARYALQQITVLGFAVLPVLFLPAWRQQPYQQRVETIRILIWLYVLFLLLLGLALMKGLSLIDLRGDKMKYNLWPMNRAAVLAALLCPLLCYAASLMRAPRLLIFSLAILTTVMVFASHSETAKLMLLVALPVYMLARHGRRWFVPVVLFVTLALFLSFPFLIKPLTEFMRTTPLWMDNIGAAESRALLWSSMSDLPFRSPLTGLGVEFVRFHKFMHPLFPEPTSELHPHTILLQLWIDLGLVGVALVMAFLARVLLFSRAVKKQGGELIIVFVLGALTVWAVSHGMWQAWYVAIVALAASVLFAVIDIVTAKPQQELESKPATNLSRNALELDWFFWPATYTVLAVLLVMARQQLSETYDLSAWQMAPFLLISAGSAFAVVLALAHRRLIPGVSSAAILFAALATGFFILSSYFLNRSVVMPRSVPFLLLVMFPIIATSLAGKSMDADSQGSAGVSR